MRSRIWRYRSLDSLGPRGHRAVQRPFVALLTSLARAGRPEHKCRPRLAASGSRVEIVRYPVYALDPEETTRCASPPLASIGWAFGTGVAAGTGSAVSASSRDGVSSCPSASAPVPSALRRGMSRSSHLGIHQFGRRGAPSWPARAACGRRWRRAGRRAPGRGRTASEVAVVLEHERAEHDHHDGGGGGDDPGGRGEAVGDRRWRSRRCLSYSSRTRESRKTS